MAGQASFWSTTFFWEQDLRSLFMNGLLNSVLKPGIYNANIGVFATTGNNAVDSKISDPGVYLYLKRGTTFVFSNNYVVNNSQYTPEFENSGNFLIKSVVLQDTVEPLITVANPGSTINVTPDLKAFFGFKKDSETYYPLPEIYVTAMMKFSGAGSLGNTAGYDSKPVFSWAANKSYAYINAQEHPDLDTSIFEGENSPYLRIAKLLSVSDISNTSYSAWGKGFYFLDASTLKNRSYYEHLFPAEGIASGEDSGPKTYLAKGYYNRTSYLTVGRCLRIRDTIGNNISYISGGGNWQGNDVTAWNQDYVFSAAGLPAYQQQQTPGQISARPSLIPILDHTHTTDNDNPNRAIESKTQFTFNLKNLSIKNKLWSYPQSGNYYDSLVLCNASVDGTFTPKDFSDSSLTAEDQIIVDFFYLLIKEKLNRATGIEIKDLLKSSDSNFDTRIKQFAFIVKDSEDSEDSELFSELFNKLCVVTPSGQELHTEKFKRQYGSENLVLSDDTIPVTPDSHSYFNNADRNKVDGTHYISEVFSPLDVSPLNIQRLQEILNSSNFLSNIIDYFRQSAPGQLSLSNEDDPAKPADILVPLALTFRPIKADSSSGDGVATLKGLVNPANILDFFSLQAPGSKVHAVPLSDNDLYTILPVMN